MSVPAYLLVPHDRTEPGPAVLAIHGHGPGKARICGVLDDDARRGRAVRARARERWATSCSRPTCAASASAPTGCPTTSTTATGISCARRWPASCRTSATSGTCNARSTCWPRTRSSIPQRLGAAGLSYGATCTLFLAALDERVRAAIVSCYLSSWRAAHTIPWNMCGSQVLPGQIGALEHLDLAALIAPRALLVESGTEDVIFPVDAARETVAVVAADLRAARRARRRARARRVRRRPHVARHRNPGVPGEVAVSDRRTTRPSSGSRCPARTRRTIRSTRSSCTAAGRARRVSSRANHDGALVHPGLLGDDLTVEQGAEAARWCALNALSVLQAELGDLDRIERVLTVLGFVACTPGVRAAARGRRRREPAARRRVRRGRPPQPFRDRCGRAAARRRRRDRSRGRAPRRSGSVGEALVLHVG